MTDYIASPHDKTYLLALADIVCTGVRRENRTGEDTISIFGMQQQYNLEDGFPLLTSKLVPFKSVASELLWFLEGSGDERRLAEILHGTRDPSKTTIWTQNANAPYWKPKAKYEGDLGLIYGVQWREWATPREITNKMSDGYGHFTIQTTDQLLELEQAIKKDPYSRRLILSAWNPGEFSQMALPPCHCFAQFYVTTDGKLDCQMYQRSSDFFLGVPFNIASYSLLTCMLAHVTGLKPGRFVHTHGDAHVYVNHLEQSTLQISRRDSLLAAPQLWLNPDVKRITDFKMTDISILNYQHLGPIKAPMAV